MERDSPIKLFMCCSTLIIGNSNNKPTSFINNTKCVPFKNELYSPATVKNRYANIRPVMFNNKGINEKK